MQLNVVCIGAIPNLGSMTTKDDMEDGCKFSLCLKSKCVGPTGKRTYVRDEDKCICTLAPETYENQFGVTVRVKCAGTASEKAECPYWNND